MYRPHRAVMNQTSKATKRIASHLLFPVAATQAAHLPQRRIITVPAACRGTRLSLSVLNDATAPDRVVPRSAGPAIAIVSERSPGAVSTGPAAQNAGFSEYVPHSSRSAAQISPSVASAWAAARMGGIMFSLDLAAAMTAARARSTAPASRPAR